MAFTFVVCVCAHGNGKCGNLSQITFTPSIVLQGSQRRQLEFELRASEIEILSQDV